MRIGATLKLVQDQFSQLLGSLGVVVQLLSATGTDDLTFPDMDLSTRSTFFRSRLYAAFTEQVQLKKYLILLQLSAGGTLPSDQDINELLESCLCELRKASLGFMRVWLSFSSDKMKAQFLMENVSHFDHLRSWLPSHRLHCLKIFVSTNTVWNTVTKDHVLDGAYFLCSDS